MEILKNILKETSDEFLSEAKNALTVISDMAVMEKYIAESYDNRILIELLQNADDSKSTKVKCFVFQNCFIFANNGRAFSQEDVVSISRSGASKKTKENIGFRGIGFKSVVSITNEILIHSNDTYFAFSKKMTADKLGVSCDKIPTIRIPFYVNRNDINEEIDGQIRLLVEEGYTSIFVFQSCKMDVIVNEVEDLNKNYFLFLNNLESFESKVNGTLRIINVKRKSCTVELYDNNQVNTWKIIGNQQNENNLKIAFLMHDNRIVCCEEKECKLTNYLPTLDSAPIPCIINADFITDPARKHLQKNIVNDEIMQSAGQIFSDAVIKYCNGTEKNFGIFSVLNDRKCYDGYSNIFFDIINQELKQYVNSKKLRFFASEFDFNEIKYFQNSFDSVLQIAKDEYFDGMKYLSKFSKNEISSSEILSLMTVQSFVTSIPESLYFKILVLGIKRLRAMSMVHDVNNDIKNVLSYQGQKTIEDDLEYIKHSIVPNISLQLTSEEMKWFYKQINYSPVKEEIQTVQEKPTVVHKKNVISKWRTAEQQCMDIEKSFGNQAVYVGNKNLGYDVESVDCKGNKRYIEVKLLTSLNGNFSLTNNEYTCAHQNGDNYFICLMYIEKSEIHAVYIQNPLQNIEIEKRVKQYEWYCEQYTGEQYTFSLN